MIPAFKRKRGSIRPDWVVAVISAFSAPVKRCRPIANRSTSTTTETWILLIARTSKLSSMDRAGLAPENPARRTYDQVTLCRQSRLVDPPARIEFVRAARIPPFFPNSIGKARSDVADLTGRRFFFNGGFE